jgi:transcriptional regulator with XRE-family HTH domain
MTVGILELGDLGRLVAEERNRRGMSLREAASDIGIPFNTLARVEKGHMPDLPKFKRLVDWCGADINQFFEMHEKSVSTTDTIAEHLRADPSLPEGAAEHIATIVKELYQALAIREEASAAHLRAATTFKPEFARALGSLLKDLNKALEKEPEHDSPQRL